MKTSGLFLRGWSPRVSVFVDLGSERRDPRLEVRKAFAVAFNYPLQKRLPGIFTRETKSLGPRTTGDVQLVVYQRALERRCGPARFDGFIETDYSASIVLGRSHRLQPKPEVKRHHTTSGRRDADWISQNKKAYPLDDVRGKYQKFARITNDARDIPESEDLGRLDFPVAVRWAPQRSQSFESDLDFFQAGSRHGNQVF